MMLFFFATDKTGQGGGDLPPLNRQALRAKNLFIAEINDHNECLDSRQRQLF
jgi:hypothetical protein